MNIDEIFSAIGIHMLEGIAYHDAFQKAYDFLGLYGFSRQQAHQYIEESDGYLDLQHYYTSHYHKLLLITQISFPDIIPDTWFKRTTMDVDTSTIKSSIRDLMKKWIEWEKSTKKLYQEMRLELQSIGEIAAALELDNYILDVSDELKHAEKQFIKLETINYDLPTIIDWQQSLYKKYKRR